MARPGQQAYRKKRQRELDSAEVADSTSNNDNTYGPILPVAELDDDFDGEPLDGATFLALGKRETDKLPFYKSVAPPTPKVVPPPAQPARPQPKVRHRGLPQESWDVLFAAHFLSYREKTRSRWPPEPQLPYPAHYPPLPPAGAGSEWLSYINGYRMRNGNQGGDDTDTNDDSDNMAIEDEGGDEEAFEGHQLLDEDAPIYDVKEGQDTPDGDGDVDEGEAHESHDNTAEEEVDEEAMFNAGSAPQAPAISDSEAERMRPREPLVCILQFLNTRHILGILRYMAINISNVLDRYPAESHATMPATPVSPFPARHARWAFALLSILDSPLERSEISILRDFARAVESVAVWRYRLAVARGAPEAELPRIPVLPGFNPPDSAVPVAEEEAGGQGCGDGKPAWTIGAKWKRVRDARPRSEPTPRPESFAAQGHDEHAVDETLARCWITSHAVVAGWAQWDLVDDFRKDFTRLAREAQ